MRFRIAWLLAAAALMQPTTLRAQDAAGDGSSDWVWPVLAACVIAASAAVPFLRTRRLRTVFLSYRRADTANETAAVSNRVARRFGRRRVFHDVKSLRPGERFKETIARVLSRCDAVLIMIGPDWTTSKLDNGRLRLHEPDDVVRAEVGAALDSGALVVPILVRGASPPRLGELPPDLAPLCDVNMVWVDTERLDETLSATLQETAAAPVRRTPMMLVAAHLAVAVFPLVFYQALLMEEFTTTMAIVLPGLTATAAVAAMSALGRLNPARVRRVKSSELFAPLAFVAAIGTLVLLKAFNVGIRSFETFKLALTAVELAFVAYTAIALASLYENRSRP